MGKLLEILAEALWDLDRPPSVPTWEEISKSDHEQCRMDRENTLINAKYINSKYIAYFASWFDRVGHSVMDSEPAPEDLCKCGHQFGDHDWGAYKNKAAGCLVVDCECEHFVMGVMVIKAEWIELVETILFDDSIKGDKAKKNITALSAELLIAVAPLIAQEAIEKAGLQFNPDYLDFQKGVEAGKIVERERIVNLLKSWESSRKDVDFITVIIDKQDWQSLSVEKGE